MIILKFSYEKTKIKCEILVKYFCRLKRMVSTTLTYCTINFKTNGFYNANIYSNGLGNSHNI